MPQEAEDLVEDMFFRFLDEQDDLLRKQRRMIEQATLIQSMPKALLTQVGPAEIRRNMQALQRQVLEYYRTGFDPVYLAGARKIDPKYTIGAADRQFLARLNTNEYLKLRTAMENVVRDSRRFAEMVWNDRDDRRRRLGIKYTHVDFVHAKPLPDNLSNLSQHHILDVLRGAGKQAKDNSERTIRLRGIKAVEYARGSTGSGSNALLHSRGKRYTLGDYGSMVTKTNASRAYNIGTLNAIQRSGNKYVSVSDGPDCGWTFHEDGDLANGSVRTVEEAMAFPIAHPNCKRAFQPATPEQGRREDERRKLGREREGKAVKKSTAAFTSERALKAVKIGAGVGVGALAAAELTNLAEKGLTRFAASGVLDDIIQRMAQAAFRGSTNVFTWVQRLTRFQDTFSAAERTLASVHPIYPGGPIDLPKLPLGDTIRYFADGTSEWFVDRTGINRIPDKVAKAIGSLEDTIGEHTSDRFQMFYQAAKKAALSEDTGENIRRVIDMEAKRRGMFYRALDSLPGGPEIRASWSKWGPRLRLDVTDWLRTKVTATPTGMIKTAAFNAAGQVRGVLKMYQDGLLGGHISVLPKNIANGIFRAIVEIDENGYLVGNLRLVPGGPLRLRLEFITDNVTQDLRDFRISPLGAIGNTVEQFRKFKFDRAVLEFRIFNKSALEIAGNLRLPVEDIRRALRAAKEVGDVIEATGANRYTGTLKYFFQNPESLKKIFEGSKASMFGNIRFANLTRQAVGDSKVVKLLGELNLRLLTRAHLDNKGLQAIATNMRIHGWAVYDIANVLKIRAQDAAILIRNGSARLERFMVDLGVRNYEDILPTWRQRVGDAQVIVRRSRKADSPNANMADAISHALRPFYYGGSPKQVNAYEIRALQTLANLQKGDTVQQVINKLTNMLNFLREQEWVEGNYVAGQADGITSWMIRLTARELVSRARTLRVV